MISEVSVGRIRHFSGVNWIGVAGLMRRQMAAALSNVNYFVLGPVVSNALYLLMFATIVSTMSSLDAQEVLNFVAPGLICFAISERAYEISGSQLIYEKHGRIHYDWMMAPLTPMERTLCFGATSTFSGLIIGACVGVTSLFFMTPAAQHPWAIAVFGLGAGLFHGMAGTLLGIWAEKWDQYTALHTFVLLPLAFLSGVFNDISKLPEMVQTLIHLNPIFYMIDGFRYGVTGQNVVNPLLGLMIVFVSNAVLLFWAYRWFASGFRLKT